MNWVEEAVGFACDGDRLVGVLARPAFAPETGVVIVVGGPQYRVGSHRQFVLLSRALADAGFAALRFDFRGMGDSGGTPRGFEFGSSDVEAAIDTLQERVPSVRQVVLIGLCDGASAALLYGHDRNDHRVRGLCLLNPWVRSEASLAVTHVKHYYTRRLLQREFWRKLVRGRIGLDAVKGAVRSVRMAAGGTNAGSEASGPTGTRLPYQQRMADAWSRFAGSILLVLSGDDFTAKEFVEHLRQSAPWKGALQRGKLETHQLAGADHTFSDGSARRAMETLIVNWLGRAFAKSPAPAALAASSVEP